MVYVSILVFVLAAVLLVKSADVLINNAEKIGLSLRVPPFLVGVIILSIGTSLPELAAGISATIKGHSELVTADVMGSNIANIFLGLGAVAFLTQRHIQFKQNVFEVHFPILIMAVFVFVISISDQIISRGEGGVFISILFAYLWFLYAKNRQPDVVNYNIEKQKIIGFRKNFLQRFCSIFTIKKHSFQSLQTSTKSIDTNLTFKPKYAVWVLVGGMGLAIAAHFLVESLLNIAVIFEVSQSVLAASLVSISTSLPEIIVGIKAAKKGRYDELVGNILGSNIFNILLILSITSFIHPLTVSDQSITLLLPFFLGSMVVYWVCKKDKQITMQEGGAMLILYCLYLGKLYGVV